MKEHENEKYNEVGVINPYLVNGQKRPLPSGQFINETDFLEGLERLYKKNEQEGKTYVVEEDKAEYKLSEKSIKKIKREFKKCSALKLIKEKTLQKADLIRVHGKETINGILKKVTTDLVVEKNKGEFIEGNYIQILDVINAIGKGIEKKSSQWTRKMLDKLKEDKAERMSKTIYDLQLEETTTFAEEMKKVL